MKDRTEGIVLDVIFEMGRFVVGQFTIIEERRAVEGETTLELGDGNLKKPHRQSALLIMSEKTSSVGYLSGFFNLPEEYEASLQFQ